MCSFCKDKKKKADLFIFISRWLQKKVINTGNIDYNVCELRLVGMSIQSTVQGLSSQSSCFCFILTLLIDQTFFQWKLSLSVVVVSDMWSCGFNRLTPSISDGGRSIGGLDIQPLKGSNQMTPQKSKSVLKSGIWLYCQHRLFSLLGGGIQQWV